MRKLLLILLSSLSLTTFAQKKPIDTLETGNGHIVFYDNKTWEYLETLNFDGIMNEDLHQVLSTSFKDLKLSQKWDNDVCFTSEHKNDFSRLKDTLWLCVNENGASDFNIPFDGIITSRYGFRKGRNHNGIDISLNTGDSIRAAWSGKVRYSKYNNGGFGNLVILRHTNGLETFYAHMSKLLVQPNQDVVAGQVIGLGGNTGRSFGAHLHFEVRFYDVPMNPEEVIDFANKTTKDDNLMVHSGIFRPGAKPSDYMNGGDDHNHGAESVAVAKSATVASKKYYKVRSGDTLSKIAVKHNTTITKLCQLNGISRNTTLQLDRNLRVK